jgi:hypothetical protein
MSAIFNLNKDDEIKMTVGQKGSAFLDLEGEECGLWGGGGGGGGTFIWKNTNPIIISGGGGGHTIMKMEAGRGCGDGAANGDDNGGNGGYFFRGTTRGDNAISDGGFGGGGTSSSDGGGGGGGGYIGGYGVAGAGWWSPGGDGGGILSSRSRDSFKDYGIANFGKLTILDSSSESWYSGGRGGSSYVNNDHIVGSILDQRAASSSDGRSNRDGNGEVIIEYLGPQIVSAPQVRRRA